MFCYNLYMSIWHKLLFWIGLRQDPGPHYYELSESLHSTLVSLSQQEDRPEDQLAEALLASGLNTYYSQDEHWQRWQSLTPREQDAAALACLGYTNKQIALRMSISPETVKTHLRNGLAKFGLHSRSELRLLLENWDFSAWE